MCRKIATFSLSSKTIKVLKTNHELTGVSMSRQIDRAFTKNIKMKRLGEV